MGLGGKTDLSQESEMSNLHSTDLVTRFYNTQPKAGRSDRELSPVVNLRKFNNWVKAVQIGNAALGWPNGRKAAVLDIGCGKGGDINKWGSVNAHQYVGIDVAVEAVKEAEKRKRTMGQNALKAAFYVLDCYSYPMSLALPARFCSPNVYDVVSMQFSMHYAFGSVERVRMMLRNVAGSLRPGGKFIGSVPDSAFLLECLSKLPEDQTSFGNDHYQINFRDRNQRGIYGRLYHFFLQDAVDVGEYLVLWDSFIVLAAEFRLRLKYRKTFHEVYSEERHVDGGYLLRKMGVTDRIGRMSMSAAEWDVARIYIAFAFEKF